MRTLDQAQLEAFDTEYVFGDRWKAITEHIQEDFPNGRFRFLDVGGGIGALADKVPDLYPSSSGVVLDNSEYFLSRNKARSRKKLVLSSVENRKTFDEIFDLIFVHWLLHHLVGSSYRESRNNQLDTLCELRYLLRENGRISIYENIYTGKIAKSLPGWVIYRLTSIRIISALTRRLGANTAGIGVCFLAREPWNETLKSAGLDVLCYEEPDSWTWEVNSLLDLVLCIKSIRVGHF